MIIINKILKRMILVLATALLLTVILYVLFCLYIKSVILDIYVSDGSSIPSCINDGELAKNINPRHNIQTENEAISDDDIRENYNIMLIPLIDFWNGKIYYNYSYTVYNKDEIIYGSSQVPVTLTFKIIGLDFKIIDYYEPA